MKSKIIRLAVFALFFSSAVFGQKVISTQEQASTQGESWKNPMPVSLETPIKGITEEPRQTLYFSFEAPVSAIYHFTTTDKTGKGPAFFLYKGTNIVESGMSINKGLKPGRYVCCARMDDHEKGQPYSFIITQNQSYWYKPDEELVANASKAIAAPLYEKIDVKIEQQKQVFYYCFEISETDFYQIRNTEKESYLSISLFDSKFRQIDHELSTTSREREVHELSPGKYYLRVSHFHGENCSFVVTKKGEYGWKRSMPNLPAVLFYFVKGEINDRWVDSSFWSYVCAALILLLIPLLLYFVIYKPYDIFLQRKYNYELFGEYFWMLVGFIGITMLIVMLFGFKLGTTMIVIIALADILFTVLLALDLYKASKNIPLIVIHILLAHLFLYVFVYLAYFLIAVVLLLFFFVKGVGAAADMQEQSGKSSVCMNCGSPIGSCSCGKKEVRY